MKINMDGAFDSKTGDGGINVAIRKSMGDDPAHGVEICRKGKDAKEVEALHAGRGWHWPQNGADRRRFWKLIAAP